MATERRGSCEEVLAGLDSPRWDLLLGGVAKAVEWIENANPGDQRAAELVPRIVELANHEKWEIRRAVAQAASRIPRLQFEPVLARLKVDTNARVRQAANEASLRARDNRGAGVFAHEHRDRITASLDSIQSKFGIPGREAVRKTAEDIANTFARELYHEVIKLMSPLGASAQRLQLQLRAETGRTDELMAEATRIATQVRHLEAVLNAMRAYTAVPVLEFAVESMRDVCDQAVQLAEGGVAEGSRPGVIVRLSNECDCEISRSRLVQALTNLLVNAIESYDGLPSPVVPIEVFDELAEGAVTIVIRDFGIGMSPDVLRDAPTLFATRKPTGTGFGLPLAIKIVESEHGGKLHLSSTKGVGTEVRVVLPIRHVEAM